MAMGVGGGGHRHMTTPGCVLCVWGGGGAHDYVWVCVVYCVGGSPDYTCGMVVGLYAGGCAWWKHSTPRGTPGSACQTDQSAGPMHGPLPPTHPAGPWHA